ncbi:MAG: response regulator transcription factor [Thiolinea sp.]
MQDLLVIEDVRETGQWLQCLLEEAFPGVRIKICSNCQLTRDYLQINRPELALVDINLPDGSGLELIPEILRASPQAFIVITTILDDQEHILTALQAGANGYLLKDLPEAQFIAKLRGILRGDPPLSPRVARKVLQYFNNGDSSVSKAAASATEAGHAQEIGVLSEREREVFILIAKGLSRKEVAGLLNLSDNTIATHVRNVYRKLNISSRAEAALEACRLGLINADL